MLFYTASLGPPLGDSTVMYAPPLRYKREALAAYYKLFKILRLTLDSALDTPKLSHTLSRLRKHKQYNRQWT